MSSTDTQAAARIDVFLVDDHPLVRRGLRQIVESEPDMRVVGEADNATEALRLICDLKPSVAIVDISLRDSNGIELVKNLHQVQPGLAVLVLSIHDEAYYAERLLRAGAGGYVMKDEPPEEILQAIRQVVAGQMRLSPRMSTRLLGRMMGRSATDGGVSVGRLSDREMEILDMIGSGLGTRQIAGDLNISTKTVEAHRENIKKKLNLSDANDLVQYAVRWVLQEGAGRSSPRDPG